MTKMYSTEKRRAMRSRKESAQRGEQGYGESGGDLEYTGKRYATGTNKSKRDRARDREDRGVAAPKKSDNLQRSVPFSSKKPGRGLNLKSFEESALQWFYHHWVPDVLKPGQDSRTGGMSFDQFKLFYLARYASARHVKWFDAVNGVSEEHPKWLLAVNPHKVRRELKWYQQPPGSRFGSSAWQAYCGSVRDYTNPGSKIQQSYNADGYCGRKILGAVGQNKVARGVKVGPEFRPDRPGHPGGPRQAEKALQVGIRNVLAPKPKSVNPFDVIVGGRVIVKKTPAKPVPPVPTQFSGGVMGRHLNRAARRALKFGVGLGERIVPEVVRDALDAVKIETNRPEVAPSLVGGGVPVVHGGVKSNPNQLPPGAPNSYQRRLARRAHLQPEPRRWGLDDPNPVWWDERYWPAEVTDKRKAYWELTKKLIRRSSWAQVRYERLREDLSPGVPPPFKFKLVSSLNGSNGEWTNTDDLKVSATGRYSYLTMSLGFTAFIGQVNNIADNGIVAFIMGNQLTHWPTRLAFHFERLSLEQNGYSPFTASAPYGPALDLVTDMEAIFGNLYDPANFSKMMIENDGRQIGALPGAPFFDTSRLPEPTAGHPWSCGFITESGICTPNVGVLRLFGIVLTLGFFCWTAYIAWHATRSFVAWLNGSNGSATNTDDHAAPNQAHLAQQARQRNIRVAGNHRHQRNPGAGGGIPGPIQPPLQAPVLMPQPPPPPPPNIQDLLATLLADPVHGQCAHGILAHGFPEPEDEDDLKRLKLEIEKLERFHPVMAARLYVRSLTPAVSTFELLKLHLRGSIGNMSFGWTSGFVFGGAVTAGLGATLGLRMLFGQVRFAPKFVSSGFLSLARRVGKLVFRTTLLALAAFYGYCRVYAPLPDAQPNNMVGIGNVREEVTRNIPPGDWLINAGPETYLGRSGLDATIETYFSPGIVNEMLRLKPGAVSTPNLAPSLVALFYSQHETTEAFRHRGLNMPMISVETVYNSARYAAQSIDLANRRAAWSNATIGGLPRYTC